MRALVSYGIAFLILVVAGLWLGTGTLVIGGNGPGEGERPIISVIEGEEHGPIATRLADAGVLAAHETDHAVDPEVTIAQRSEAEEGGQANLQSVRTQTFTAQPMSMDVSLRGQTRAKSTVTAVAETAGIVDIVHVTKGQNVAAGDLLCTLDQGTRAAAVAQAEASRAQAEASLEQARADLETNADLRERGLAAPNTGRQLQVAVSAAEAGVTSAQAALDNAEAELERTTILAKVDGVVQDPVATAGAFLAAGSPCATIVQLDPIVFVGQVPEARIGLARTGLDATVSTVTNQNAAGKVTFISSTADPATRSFPVEIELSNKGNAIRDGITATATVNMGQAPAHLLPQSVLTLNDEGVLGVSTVVGDVVKFLPVTISNDTREGVWIVGLPPTVEIVTVGQEYVTDGQTVNASNVTAADGDAQANTATAS